MKWIATVKFIGRQMVGTEGSETYIPFDDFCMNTEFVRWRESLGMMWRWVEQWERR